MNRNLIFVFILFTTFSIINAVPHQLRKRETEFFPCGVSDIGPLTVKISPDPLVSEQPATYTVSGTLTYNITAGSTILQITYDDGQGNPLGGPFVQVFTDSYKAGTPFTIAAIDVQTPKLPDSYAIGVFVESEEGIIGCAFAVIPKSAEKEAYPIAGYPIKGFSYPIAERS